jgi:ABC-type nitrate/sulfonate/bicarbonate transport system substrate-binding protein
MEPMKRLISLIVPVAGLAAFAVGCGSSSDSSSTSTPAPAASTTAATGATSLAGVCPSTVVVQTDWNPESDHSEVYELAATGGTIDAAKKRYTAPLISQGQDTGVKIEIRAGGPATGFQSPTQQMYSDDSIYMGYVNTDESIQNAAKKPTVSVMAPRENWAQVLIFDPATYHFKTIADIGKTNATVLYFQANVYMDYLVGAGILKKSQVDASYDGKPARFVTAGGKVVQQGFLTAEPYQYEHEVKPWLKPVSTLKISDAGYPNYGETLAVRKADVAKDSPCLKKLVPMIQQAQVDYAKSPERANTLIAQLVPKYNTGWVYPKALADFAAKAQVDNKIIADGTDGTLGSIDTARVQKMIDIVSPIYAKNNIKVPAGLKPSDLFTNEFVKQGIGL